MRRLGMPTEIMPQECKVSLYKKLKLTKDTYKGKLVEEMANIMLR